MLVAHSIQRQHSLQILRCVFGFEITPERVLELCSGTAVLALFFNLSGIIDRYAPCTNTEIFKVDLSSAFQKPLRTPRLNNLIKKYQNPAKSIISCAVITKRKIII